MVIGSTPAEAEDIAALVEVEFETLPPVVSMSDALQKGPPFVHEEWGDNILVDLKFEAGDLAAAKSAAAYIVERSFRMKQPHRNRRCHWRGQYDIGSGGRRHDPAHPGTDHFRRGRHHWSGIRAKPANWADPQVPIGLTGSAFSTCFDAWPSAAGRRREHCPAVNCRCWQFAAAL